MRKLIGTLVVGLLILGGIGFMRGWLSVSSDSEAEKTRIEVTVDREQLKQDAERIKEGVQGVTENIRSSAGESPADASENGQ